MSDATDTSRRRRQVPLWLKTTYVLFVAIHIPVWVTYYAPDRYLWFTNFGLLSITLAMLLESRWLASTQAISIGLLEFFWIFGFIAGLILGGDSPIALTAYMFDADEALHVRILSAHHLFLPFVILYVVYRLGYEPRAWLVWTPVAWIILLLTYLLTDPQDNINSVFGPGGEPQALMPEPLYLFLVMAFFPLVVYYPTHRLLLWFYGKLGAVHAPNGHSG
jgi:hypothetical protein